MSPSIEFAARLAFNDPILRSYKGTGVQILDERGNRDVTEFINVAKDDALAWPAVVYRTYPPTVAARMESTIKPFVEKLLAINHFLIDVLNDKLGLPKSNLAESHKVHEHTGCIARAICAICAPPRPVPGEKLFLSAHTDYGPLVSPYMRSLRRALSYVRHQSFLHNRLSGLQVLPPGSDRWLYVKVRNVHVLC